MWERLDYREKYIPRVTTNPCFPAMTSDIQCGECVSACKWNAVTRDMGTITVHADRCRFCGECYAACPGDVIAIMPLEALMFSLRRDRGEGARTVYLFCDRVSPGEALGSLQVPTLSYVVPELLFWAAAIGYEEVSVAAWKCLDCKSGCRERFASSVLTVNDWLHAWGRQLAVSYDDRADSREKRPPRLLSRRELLRGLGKNIGASLGEYVSNEVVNRLPMLIPRAEEGMVRRQALLAVAMKMLGEPRDTPPTSQMPAVDDACQGCRLCSKLCTRGAIVYSRQGLTIKPWLCSGCGFCARTCPEKLITLTRVGEWRAWFRSINHPFAPASPDPDHD